VPWLLLLAARASPTTKWVNHDVRQAFQRLSNLTVRLESGTYRELHAFTIRCAARVPIAAYPMATPPRERQDVLFVADSWDCKSSDELGSESRVV
jgi:hypothetical protein